MKHRESYKPKRPICQNCNKPMKQVWDKIAKKYTGHSFTCKCMKGLVLSIG